MNRASAQATRKNSPGGDKPLESGDLASLRHTRDWVEDVSFPGSRVLNRLPFF